ncbi:hypothetical protein HK107_11845 [Parvularcula sp. ZS-1/3]|uniref:ATP-grasp domain-containing protein n=1 Tax=Parvularcula mediterranea TaxID=2732508 RepID=A0A7Y3RMW7_9PROT|nr:hypothetical protein [Parvularcula mediterranea]NNU17013.1 hypothetical protein [Parvularcula mediterranea]
MTLSRIESMTGWLADVRLTSRGLQHRETGHRVPLDPSGLKDIYRWIEFDRTLRRAPTLRREKLKICFTPKRARPWYFARSIVDHLGAELVENPAEAEIVWSFEDATFTKPTVVPANKIAINAQCTDVSKTTVGRISEIAFGESLTVDPRTYHGKMVMKSEINGAHDGRMVEGPVAPTKGFVYQRLIDNRTGEGMVEDLRTTIVGGEPVLVFKKRRSEDGRFLNSNDEVELTSLDAVFSQEEQEAIGVFAKTIKLDAGGLDVLRDRTSGKLFIVDANKTDMGPPLALPMADKMLATRLMAEALEDFIMGERALRPDADTGSLRPAPSQRPTDLVEAAI